jgi:hypothetical protein
MIEISKKMGGKMGKEIGEEIAILEYLASR